MIFRVFSLESGGLVMKTKAKLVVGLVLVLAAVIGYFTFGRNKALKLNCLMYKRELLPKPLRRKAG